MVLKKYLRNCNKDISIQLFDKQWKVKVYLYSKKEVKQGKVDVSLLDMEVMETNEEEDCLEIWIR